MLISLSASLSRHRLAVWRHSVRMARNAGPSDARDELDLEAPSNISVSGSSCSTSSITVSWHFNSSGSVACDESPASQVHSRVTQSISSFQVSYQPINAK